MLHWGWGVGGGGCWEDKGAAGAGGEGGGRRRESSRPASGQQAPPRLASRDPGDLTSRVEGGGRGGGEAPPPNARPWLPSCVVHSSHSLLPASLRAPQGNLASTAARFPPGKCERL